MNISINTTVLTRELKEMLDDVSPSGPFESGSIAIGKHKGREIVLMVTSEEDDFHSLVVECIEVSD